MILKMNKHVLNYDVFEIVKLNSQWESFIPKRPTLPEYNTNNEDNDNTDAYDEYEAFKYKYQSKKSDSCDYISPTYLIH